MSVEGMVWVSADSPGHACDGFIVLVAEVYNRQANDFGCNVGDLGEFISISDGYHVIVTGGAVKKDGLNNAGV